MSRTNAPSVSPRYLLPLYWNVNSVEIEKEYHFFRHRSGTWVPRDQTLIPSIVTSIYEFRGKYRNGARVYRHVGDILDALSHQYADRISNGTCESLEF